MPPLSDGSRAAPPLSTARAPNVAAIREGRQDHTPRASRPLARARTAAAPPTQPLLSVSPGKTPTQGPQSLWFTKHELARLFHVMCQRGVAASVVASRGLLTRQQLEARVAKQDVWDTVVAPEFNDFIEMFTPRAECKHFEMNPNLHSHGRSGSKLKSKFTEISDPDELERIRIHYVRMLFVTALAFMAAMTYLTVPCFLLCDWTYGRRVH